MEAGFLTENTLYTLEQEKWCYIILKCKLSYKSNKKVKHMKN